MLLSGKLLPTAHHCMTMRSPAVDAAVHLVEVPPGARPPGALCSGNSSCSVSAVCCCIPLAGHAVCLLQVQQGPCHAVRQV